MYHPVCLPPLLLVLLQVDALTKQLSNLHHSTKREADLIRASHAREVGTPYYVQSSLFAFPINLCLTGQEKSMLTNNAFRLLPVSAVRCT